MTTDGGHLRKQILNDGSTETSLDSPGDAILDYVVSGIETEPHEQSERKKRLRNDIMRVIHNPETLPSDLRRDKRKFALSQSRKRSLQEEFIDSFSYAGMDSRRTRIVLANQKTLRWIFDPPRECKEMVGFQKVARV